MWTRLVARTGVGADHRPGRHRAPAGPLRRADLGACRAASRLVARGVGPAGRVSADRRGEPDRPVEVPARGPKRGPAGGGSRARPVLSAGIDDARTCWPCPGSALPASISWTSRRRRSISGAPPNLVERREPPFGTGSLQGGARVTSTAGRVDWGASFYRGLRTFPTVTVRPSQPPLLETFPRYTMVGADFETVRGAWGVRGEAAFFDRQSDRGRGRRRSAGRQLPPGRQPPLRQQAGRRQSGRGNRTSRLSRPPTAASPARRAR